MRTTPVLTIFAALTLAACNQAPSSNAADAAAPATAPAAASSIDASIGIKPGKWENNYEVLEASGAGVPAQALAAMKGKAQNITTCVTPEQAKTGVRDLLRGQDGGKCTFDKYQFGGGRIDTQLSCAMPNGGTVTRSTGTYTDTSYEAVGEATISGRMAMTVKSRSSGRWIGECTAPVK